MPAALAHGLQSVAAPRALEFVEQSGHQPATRGAQGMPECDGAPVGIHLGKVESAFLLPGEHHRSEGLVDLDHVDVVLRHAGFRERILGGGNRRREHPNRVGASHRQVVDARPGREPVGLEGLFGNHQHGRRGVGDLAGDRRGEAPALHQGFQGGHLGQIALTRGFVVGEVAHGYDLALEVTGGDGRKRAVVALECELLHVLATDVPLLGDHFGRTKL